MAEAPLERGDEPPPAVGAQVDAAAGRLEIGRLDLAVVDRLDDDRVGDQGPERLHQVERERRPAVARLVVEAAVGIEPDGRQGDRPGPDQQRIGEREQRVDGIFRGTAVPRLEFERELAVRRRLLQQGAERLKVAGGGGPFDAEQFRQ